MFAIALNNVLMNTGDRYFDFTASQFHVINGTKKSINIPLQPCKIDQWERFGD